MQNVARIKILPPQQNVLHKKRAGHLYKENSHCSMSGTNKRVLTLKEGLKNLEIYIAECYLPFGLHVFISNMYTCIFIHVALLTNLQTDCLKPDIFILRTDLCPFHDCVSCSLHATCHLF